MDKDGLKSWVLTALPEWPCFQSYEFELNLCFCFVCWLWPLAAVVSTPSSIGSWAFLAFFVLEIVFLGNCRCVTCLQMVSKLTKYPMSVWWMHPRQGNYIFLRKLFTTSESPSSRNNLVTLQNMIEILRWMIFFCQGRCWPMPLLFSWYFRFPLRDISVPYYTL